jgi:teichuronic acid biosynthesis glycosyltransferase TuaC
MPGPRVLSFSTLYPNPLEPASGPFVQRRLAHLAALVDLRVVGPFARMVYAHRSPGIRPLPASGFDGTLEVLRPGWFYPPLMGGINPILLAIQAFPTVLRLRRTFPFELIDAQFGHPDGAAAALLAACFKVPFTITLRGAEADHAEHFGRRWLMRWAFRRAARIFPVSMRLRALAISLGAPRERAIAIPNGVDSSLFFPRGIGPAREQLGIPADVPVLFSAGHLIELKGHDGIMRAVHTLRRAGLAVRLFIAGGAGSAASFEGQLLRLRAELGLENAVTFLGPVPPEKMPLWFSAADVYCLFSRREGWPNVVNEALACGTPVVAADVGAVPEMIPSLDYGTVTPAGNVTALTAALETALVRRWDRAAIAAWGQSRSWMHTAREVAREFAAVIAEKRR